MTRREPTAGGDARRGRGKPHAGGHGKRKGRQTRRAKRHATHATHAATETRAVGERPAAGSVWRAGAGASVGVTPLLALDPAPSAAGAALLTLAGAEHATLRGALQAWDAARDEAANRVWRRPGGLRRLAGL
ncbi:MAG TPA: hypothetical protein VF725_14140 [Ktedonobacterales bacterium]